MLNTNGLLQNPCPEEGSSFLSRLLFAWFDSLAWTGFRKPLETKDLWAMNPEDCAPEIVPLFDKYWRRTVEQCGRYASSLFVITITHIARDNSV